MTRIEVLVSIIIAIILGMLLNIMVYILESYCKSIKNKRGEKMLWLAKIKLIKTVVVSIIKLTPTKKDDEFLKGVEDKIKDIFK